MTPLGMQWEVFFIPVTSKVNDFIYIFRQYNVSTGRDREISIILGDPKIEGGPTPSV